MWDELSKKVKKAADEGKPLKVLWESDGEEGKGQLVDMQVNPDRVSFKIKNIIQEKPVLRTEMFEMSSIRESCGISGDQGNIRISGPYMGSIEVILDKELTGHQTPGKSD